MPSIWWSPASSSRTPNASTCSRPVRRPSTSTSLRRLVDTAVAAGHRGVDVGRAPDGDENDPALIVFTAGTTGLAKGATLAHRSWIATLHQTLAVSHRLPDKLPDDDPGFVSLLTGPLFHIGGLHALGLALLSGGTLVFLEGRFERRSSPAADREAQSGGLGGHTDHDPPGARAPLAA